MCFLYGIYLVYYIKNKIMAILSESINGNIIEVTIQSSNIKTAMYYTLEEKLSITFNNGAIYEYEKVPWSVFTKFRMSESQGKFFNQSISKTYKFTKIQ
jgi:hypothetical protein